ncbi:MAG TPA: hypothetical protein VD884_18495 [Ohtaekwangia sp.]|nr:hypothetical protein [Ohtaekwangia sp.]
MELEDLKSIWKNNRASFQQKGEAEIAAMLKGTSKSIIDKLKRNVWIELSITFIAGIGLLIYALTLTTGAVKWTSIAILAIFVAYTVYYIKKLILLSRFSASNENIRVNLEQLTYKLSSYLKFYKRSYTIMYPVYFSLGILFSGMENGTDRFFEVLSETKTIVIVLTIGIAYYICSTWLATWLLKKLYGNHLERLKNLLRDLSPEEPVQ